MAEPGGTGTTAKSAPDTSRTVTLSRATLAWMLAGAGTLVGVTTWAITVAVARPHTWGIGQWISDFFKSSGFAGLLAICAAGLAFYGLTRQLKQQRTAEANRAWWERFQWTSSRALPADPNHEALPYDAIVSTFTALVESASDNVQRGAVGAVMDVASRPDPADEPIRETEPSEPDEEVSRGPVPSKGSSMFSFRRLSPIDLFPPSNLHLEVLTDYVKKTQGTAADSPQTRAKLDEAQMIHAALMAGVNIVESPAYQRNDWPDYVVDVNGSRIGIEVLMNRAPGTRQLIPNGMALRQWKRFARRADTSALIIVSNMDVALPNDAADTGLYAFRWTGAPGDADRLVQRLNELASAAGSEG